MEEVTEKKETKKQIKIKIGFVVGILLVWITLIGIKLTNKEFSLLIPSILTGIATLIIVLSLFFKQITDKFFKAKEISEIPEPLKREEVLGKAYEIIKGTPEKDYLDGYFRNINSKSDQFSRPIEKQTIWAIRLRLSAPILLMGEEEEQKQDTVWIIINANYHDYSIYRGNMKVFEVEEKMNHLARGYEEPDTIKKIRTMDEFNRPTETEIEKIRRKKQEDSVA